MDAGIGGELGDRDVDAVEGDGSSGVDRLVEVFQQGPCRLAFACSGVEPGEVDDGFEAADRVADRGGPGCQREAGEP